MEKRELEQTVPEQELSAEFYRRLLGIPLCERTGECNGCGRCGEVGRVSNCKSPLPEKDGKPNQ